MIGKISVLAVNEKPHKTSKLNVEVFSTSPAEPSCIVVPFMLFPLPPEQASVVEPVGGKVPAEGVAEAVEDEAADDEVGVVGVTVELGVDPTVTVVVAPATAPAGATVVVTDALQLDFLSPSEPPTPPPTAAAIITTTSARLRKKVGFLRPKIRPFSSPPGV